MTGSRFIDFGRMHEQKIKTETNRIELKQQLTDDFEKEVIVFLNYHGGGVLYVGIDKNSNILDVKDPGTTMLKIKDRLKIIFSHRVLVYLISYKDANQILEKIDLENKAFTEITSKRRQALKCSNNTRNGYQRIYT